MNSTTSTTFVFVYYELPCLIPHQLHLYLFLSRINYRVFANTTSATLVFVSVDNGYSYT